MKYIVVDNFTNQRLKEITFEIKQISMMKLVIYFFEKSCSKKVSGVFAKKHYYLLFYQDIKRIIST
jgi:hypothetical protein